MLTNEEVEAMTAVNVVHPTFLSRIALENFKDKEDKRLIVHVSSILELYHAAGLSLYCATKGFIDHFC